MPNVYLTVTIEKSWLSQNFDFRNLKDLLPSQFWGVPTQADIIEI